MLLLLLLCVQFLENDQKLLFKRVRPGKQASKQVAATTTCLLSLSSGLLFSHFACVQLMRLEVVAAVRVESPLDFCYFLRPPRSRDPYTEPLRDCQKG